MECDCLALAERLRHPTEAFVGRDLVVLGTGSGTEVDVIDEGARRLLDQLVVLLLETLEWTTNIVIVSTSAARLTIEPAMVVRITGS